ncbi:hypothetical protein J6590_043631 [Homalodisca vitripennis]|nr:hypothetical protein J6590_043631 [Homalodisca vitripennis]
MIGPRKLKGAGQHLRHLEGRYNFQQKEVFLGTIALVQRPIIERDVRDVTDDAGRACSFAVDSCGVQQSRPKEVRTASVQQSRKKTKNNSAVPALRRSNETINKSWELRLRGYLTVRQSLFLASYLERGQRRCASTRRNTHTKTNNKTTTHHPKTRSSHSKSNETISKSWELRLRGYLTIRQSLFLELCRERTAACAACPKE